MTMIKLANLLKEVSIVYGQTTYYAVFNYLGDYNNGIPLYIITTSKKSMVDKLNKAYKELTGENYIPYDLNDMEHSSTTISMMIGQQLQIVKKNLIAI